MLTRSNVITYLVNQRILSHADLVDQNFSVLELFRRNRNFLVRRRSGGGYFVKQAKVSSGGGRPSLGREAKCCALAARQAATAGLLPQLVHYDKAREIVVFRLIDGDNLLARSTRPAKLDPAAAALLGDTLARCHRGMVDVLRYGDGDRPAFPAALPATLAAGRFDNALRLKADSDGQRQVGAVILRHREFAEHIAALRGQWRANSVIHGDAKLENCLVRSKAEPAETPLVIVDWELADLGDAAWDLGGVLQSYLGVWLRSLSFDEAGKALVDPQSENATATLHETVRAFWQAYARPMGVDGELGRPFLERSVGYSGVRLLQTAVEATRQRERINSAVVHQLQASLSIVEQPAAVAGSLYGLAA